MRARTMMNRAVCALLLSLITSLAWADILYVHTDHLNTPRLATNEQGTTVWRNLPTNEPFGNSPVEEDPDGDATLTTLNPRFPGQYADKETNLHYNYFRDYDPATGRYVQSDPIGLQGGVNTYGYAEGNPIGNIDPQGLFVPRIHWEMTAAAADADCPRLRNSLAGRTRDVDFVRGSQETSSSPMHAMCIPGDSPEQCQSKINNYINSNINSCSLNGLAKALHAIQDSFSRSHTGKTWNGTLDAAHIMADMSPTPTEYAGAVAASRALIQQFKAKCPCQCNN